MRFHRRSACVRVSRLLKRQIGKIEDAGDRRTAECMVVLLSALHSGTDVDRLAAYTGYPKDFIETISQRMRKAGLWVGKLVDDEEWWDREGNLTSGFFAHALVAQGRLIRVRTEDGGCRYLDPETGDVVT
jgi:hypothetical protein